MKTLRHPALPLWHRVRYSAIRRVLVVGHRWVGLAMAAPLIFVALTGSVLVYGDELQRLIAPQLYATPQPGVPRLDLATLAEKAASLAPPHTQLAGVQMFQEDQAQLLFFPETDPKTGKPTIRSLADLPPEVLVDPWTGAELARRRRGDLSQGLVNLVPFIFYAHYQVVPLTMPATAIGLVLLGVIAVLWSVDCFVGFYLTLPVSFRGFWRQWMPAWLVKRHGGTYRVNLDLHRAFGLWLWPVLFVFAWSSVMFNMGPVYKPVMESLFDHGATRATGDRLMNPRSPALRPHPALDWREAQVVGERLMAEQAATRGFTYGEPTGFVYVAMAGTYAYQVRGSLAVESDGQAATITFDGDTGELRTFQARSGEHTDQTITAWLRALHRAKLAGPIGAPYRVFVFVLGLVITMLSVTGVYMWWRKRSVRRMKTMRRRTEA